MKYIYLLLISLLISCTFNNSRNLNQTKEITINIDSADINDFYQNLKLVKTVPLETKSGSLIGDIRKIVFKYNYFFIQDFQKHRLLLFDNYGKFIRTIGKKGKGPGEFTELRDFIVMDEKVCILTYKRILFFNLQGEVLKEVKIKAKDNILNPMEMTIQREKMIYLWNGTLGENERGSEIKYTLLGYEIESGKIVSKNFPTNRYCMAGTYLFPDHNEGSTNIIPLFGHNTIYKLNNDSLYEYLKLNFGRYNLNSDILNSGFSPDVLQQNLKLRQSDKYNVDIANFHETDLFYYFTFFHKGKMKEVLYSKVSDNYILGNANLFTMFNFTYDGYFVSLFEPQYINLVEKLYLKGKLTKHNYDILKNIDKSPDSNPIMLVYEVQEF